MLQRLRRLLFGAPRDIQDPAIFHRVSLAAFLAWVALGADGLSSSSYGPDEAFKALGDAHYLAVALAVATAFTVLVISYAYSRIIEHFPFGGGGYIVEYKLLGEVSVIGLLTALNLRGVKESVTILAPIFLLFVATHVILIGGVFFTRVTELPEIAQEVSSGFKGGFATIGFAGVFGLFLRAYSMGAGTYTGIEAVSNGLQIMREPKVETAKRTMIYMAVSLSLTAGGITLGYLLVHANPVPGQTMNAVLVDRFADNFSMLGLPLGRWFIVLTLAAETALLFVAAQTGFIDGPRVMANMATDSWLPHQFAHLSDRLTMKDGVLLISGASILTLLYTRGVTSTLVLMYSINVFLTFSLSQASMVRYWIRDRNKYPNWHRHITIHVIGLVLCVSILTVNLYEKFSEGGWLTLTVTTALIALCFWVRRHYSLVRTQLARLDDVLDALPKSTKVPPPDLSPSAPTAVLLVGHYSGLGVHSLLTIQRLFPDYFKNYIFVSIGVIDSATFKGVEVVEEVPPTTEKSLNEYVRTAHGLGLAADYRMKVGTDAVAGAEEVCVAISKQFPRSLFFAGKLIFQRERWMQRLLHNETAYKLQRRLQFAGLNAMVLPVRVMENHPAAAAA